MEQYYNFIGETLFSSYGLSISGAIEKVGKQNEISGAIEKGGKQNENEISGAISNITCCKSGLLLIM